LGADGCEVARCPKLTKVASRRAPSFAGLRRRLRGCARQVEEAQRDAARATQRLSDEAAAAAHADQSVKELKQRHQEASAELMKLRRGVQEEGAQNRLLRQQIREKAGETNGLVAAHKAELKGKCGELQHALDSTAAAAASAALRAQQRECELSADLENSHRHFEERERQLMADVATARRDAADAARLLEEHRVAQRAAGLRIHEVREPAARGQLAAEGARRVWSQHTPFDTLLPEPARKPARCARVQADGMVEEMAADMRRLQAAAAAQGAEAGAAAARAEQSAAALRLELAASCAAMATMEKRMRRMEHQAREVKSAAAGELRAERARAGEREDAAMRLLHEAHNALSTAGGAAAAAADEAVAAARDEARAALWDLEEQLCAQTAEAQRLKQGYAAEHQRHTASAAAAEEQARGEVAELQRRLRREGNEAAAAAASTAESLREENAALHARLTALHHQQEALQVATGRAKREAAAAAAGYAEQQEGVWREAAAVAAAEKVALQAELRLLRASLQAAARSHLTPQVEPSELVRVERRRQRDTRESEHGTKLWAGSQLPGRADADLLLSLLREKEEKEERRRARRIAKAQESEVHPLRKASGAY
jgi:hypothetical protein